jgi:ubiquitin carboxyl-terminal hydrolase 22/27/51
MLSAVLESILTSLSLQFYSEKPQLAPFAPTNFLFCIYLARESTEVSTGAGEHDAHELFISALNNVHSALMAVGREPSTRSSRLPMYPFGDQAYGLTASRSGTASNASDDDDHTFHFSSDIVCPCVVHRTFAGVLQSNVTCQRCERTSTAYDPFLDLSLDIRTNRARAMSLVVDVDSHDTSNKKKNKKHKDHTAKDKSLLDSLHNSAEEEQTLTDCMKRYCASETLGQSDYSCHQCGIGSTAVKQLSLCRLPPVLCFQLKRFEHNATTGTKIETRIKFSLTFDVRDYCTDSASPSFNEDGEEASSSSVDPDSYIYDLFTVIVHEGKLNTGHYYCYFRWRDNWYLANDDSLKLAKLQDVLACKAYQLCYLRRGLQNVRE